VEKCGGDSVKGTLYVLGIVVGIDGGDGLRICVCVCVWVGGCVLEIVVVFLCL
jgi:hypothetical protein